MATQMLGIKTKFTDDEGKPLIGGKVYTYFAGTSTPQDTYSDAELTIPNMNPVVLDDTGSANIFLKGVYKIRVFNRDGRYIEEQDGVSQMTTKPDFDASNNEILERVEELKFDTGIKTTLGELQPNAVQRSLAEKNSEIISVKDFGAVGDGVTDDTEAFASAISANIKVFVPYGNYLVSSPIDTNKLYGNGKINGRQLTYTHQLEKTNTLNLNSFNPNSAFERHKLTKQGVGSGNVIQGWAVDNINNELFTLHARSDSAVINKFDSHRITQTSIAYTHNASDEVGHQGFDIGWANGERWFVSGCNKSDADYGDTCVLYQLATNGDDISIDNLRKVKLFDTDKNQHVTTAISVSSRYLLAENNTTDSCTIRVFDFQKIVNSNETTYQDKHIAEFTFENNCTDYPIQSIACDDSTIYVFVGYGASKGLDLYCYCFDMLGHHIGKHKVDVGKELALAEGEHNEVEGASWTYIHNRPVLSICMASGASGERINRIWQLNANSSMVLATKDNKPAYLSAGSKDFGVLSEQDLLLGHYDPATDTWATALKTRTGGKTSFNSNNKGAVTVNATDKTSTIINVGSGYFERVGSCITIAIKCNNLDIDSLSAGNLYLQLEAETDKLLDSPIIDTMLPVVVSDFNSIDTSYYLSASIDTGGYIAVREMRSAKSNVIADVAQLNGADVYISGSYICVD